MYKMSFACMLLLLIGQAEALITLDRDGNKKLMITQKHWQDDLSVLFQTLKIEAICDLSCCLHASLPDLQMSGRDYIGIGTNLEQISMLRSKNNDDRCHFLYLDAVADALPEVDMMVCVNYFEQLGEQEACMLLRNLKASGSTFLVADTSPEIKDASPCMHAHDLTKAPFNLRKPLLYIDYKDGKQLGLWLLRDLDLTDLAY